MNTQLDSIEKKLDTLLNYFVGVQSDGLNYSEAMENLHRFSRISRNEWQGSKYVCYEGNEMWQFRTDPQYNAIYIPTDCDKKATDWYILSENE